MHTNDDLPLPETQQLAKSAALVGIICEHIQQAGGQVPFADFMQLALYHPDGGYYSSTIETIGARGDFITAPELSPLFAQCFAEQVKLVSVEMAHEVPVLELGAGTGQFAYDFLRYRNASSPYFIVEPSQALKAIQQQRLANFKVVWLEQMPSSFEGVIIANEVLDALPVHRLQWQDTHAKEWFVAWENNQFVWRLGAPSSAALQEVANALGERYHLTDGYTSEISLQSTALVKTLSQSLSRGLILLADYGYGQREYYHPQRDQGTLTCFYRHRHHANPFVYPGLQDITAHVDFTRVIETAADHGCELAGFTTQSGFLLGSGLLALAAQHEKGLSEIEIFESHQAIKTLTLPTEMGERIKIMGLAKELSNAFTAFSLQDRVRDLDT